MNAADETSLVQSVALLVLHLIDDVEACAITGLADEELDAALGDHELMRRARAEAVKLTLDGGRAEIRATRALDAAAMRLQRIAENPDSRAIDVISATNALCTLAGTREKLRSRQLSVMASSEPVVSYEFNIGEVLNVAERGLINAYRANQRAVLTDDADRGTPATGAALGRSDP